MKVLTDSLGGNSTPEERSSLSARLAEGLAEFLDLPGGIDYAFTSLGGLSDLRSASGDFRIITWEIEQSNGVIVYSGVIAWLPEGKPKSVILTDSSYARKISEYALLTEKSWYGALYYDLREYQSKNNRYIVLLGINRNERLVKKKLIEVIEYSENLRFGSEIFSFPRSFGYKRKVYRYSIEANMSIWFEDGTTSIVMDHLSPINPTYEGKEEYYAPDLSFDALHWKSGKLKYEADYDARMEKNLKDRYYEMNLPPQEKIY